MYRGVALAIMLIFVSGGPAGAFQVPHTGITGCYNEYGGQIPCPSASTDTYYGQDGRFNTINPMNYMDNGTTVTDTVTGLTWQKADVAARTWAEAVEYCNSLVLGGYSDWRLPSLSELDSLLDLTVTSGAMINPLFSVSCPDCGYWSYDTNPANLTQAWTYNYGTGEDNISGKSSTFQVRAVREVQ